MALNGATMMPRSAVAAGLVSVVPHDARMRRTDRREFRLLRAGPRERGGQQASDQNQQQPLHRTLVF